MSARTRVAEIEIADEGGIDVCTNDGLIELWVEGHSSGDSNNVWVCMTPLEAVQLSKALVNTAVETLLDEVEADEH